MQANELPDLFNHTPARKDCRAAIYFANPAFPPITYFYGSGSCHFGSENASFQVPVGVPNGDAYVTWTCGVAAHTCVRANVSEGRGTLRAPQSQDGTISCQTWSQNGNTTLSASFHSVEGGSTTNTGQKHNFEYKHNVKHNAKHNAKYKHNRNHSRKHHEYVRRWHTAVLCGYQRGSIHSTL
uniref:Uncharacterized protein n=1 Tax=Pyricularia oryzae (strain P131) TaxID=1143193 RepID=L7IU14_PYRO1